jgi:Flp pilus assembly protein TadG
MTMSSALRHQTGVAAVELALLLTPLVILVFGISEYGRAMVQYDTLCKAARAGARFLSQFEPGDATRTGQARCLVAYGNTACNEPPLAPGLTQAMVSVADSSNDAAMSRQPMTANGVTIGVANLVRVSVSGYQFNSVVAFVAPSFTFEPISVTMTQRLP